MKKKRELEAVAVQEASQETEQFKVKLKQCQSDMETLKAGMKIAELAIEEGNNEFSQCLDSRSIDRKDIRLKLQMCAQSKLDMGLKRKASLAEEIVVVEKQIKKLDDTIKKTIAFFLCMKLILCLYRRPSNKMYYLQKSCFKKIALKDL